MPAPEAHGGVSPAREGWGRIRQNAERHRCGTIVDSSCEICWKNAEDPAPRLRGSGLFSPPTQAFRPGLTCARASAL